MISAEEKRYLNWLGSCHWTGSGEIVEIGPWLGGSTYCLASGMAANPKRGERRLHCFDNFLWRPFMADRAPLPLGNGDSFEPYFRANLREFEELICVHRSSLADDANSHDHWAKTNRDVEPKSPLVSWPVGSPVEVLFVDGAKSWDGFRHLLVTFANSLLPGVSLLVMQDYKDWAAYWIPAMLELFGDKIEIVHTLPSNTVTFAVTQPISEHDAARIPAFSDIAESTCIGLVDSARKRITKAKDDDGAWIVGLSAVRLHLHKGNSRAAVSAFRQLEATWPPLTNRTALESARRWLAGQGIAELPPSARARQHAALARIRQRGLALSRRAARFFGASHGIR